MTVDRDTQIAAARERERRRARIRDAATREVASWPESLRSRLARDFERAAAEAKFISNRGRCL